MKQMRCITRWLIMLFFCTGVNLFLTDIAPGGTISFDINGDGKEGLEEAIHALQVVAGINPPYAETDEYVLFAWNDLGMHCLNPTYNTAVILPPYNTVWAQVIRKGKYPEIMTTGLTAEYNILNNTYSYGKRDYGQFWDNVQKLFGVTLEHDKGLNLNDPNLHNGLSGKMVLANDHFQADGIPVTPVNDAGAWNPYQIAEINVRNSAGNVISQTRCTVPTSDEINCAKCHESSDTFQNILKTHDAGNQTTLSADMPVLCVKCHGSPALGSTTAGSSGKYLSQAIHGFHATKYASCYDCHPGQKTQCNRSKAHTAANGKCTDCHGSMAEVASSISDGTRIPWVNEPKCAKCHSEIIAQVDTGSTLYRNAKGHGNLYCATCHGSPHAMIPSSQDSDNYQATRFQYYQNEPKTIGSCGTCHEGSKGEENEIDEFSQVHGGLNPKQLTTCHICHTEIPPSDTAKFPHAYQWKNRQ